VCVTPAGALIWDGPVHGADCSTVSFLIANSHSGLPIHQPPHTPRCTVRVALHCSFFLPPSSFFTAGAPVR